jgi:tetratricopeptide (TPR) repeat protein
MKIYYPRLAHFAIAFLFLLTHIGFAQLTPLRDTTDVKKRIAAAEQLSNSDPDSSIILINQVLDFCKKMQGGYENKFTSSALGQSGIFHYLKGDYTIALQHLEEAAKIDEKLNVKYLQAMHLGCIGIVYKEKGAYDKATDFYFRALKLSEELKHDMLIATWLANLGVIYQEQKEYDKALDIYNRSLGIGIKLNNKLLQSNNLGNIGIIYEEKKDLVKALDYFSQSKKLDEETGNQNGLSRNFDRLGNIYRAQKKYDQAEDAYRSALKIAEEIGDREHIAIVQNNMAVLYLSQKKYSAAEQNFLKSLSLAEAVGSLDDVIEANKGLSKLYEETKRPVEALSYYKKATALKDSVFNEEKNKELVRQEMNYDFARKEALAKVEQEKKDLISSQALNDQKRQRNFFIIGSVVFLIVAILMFRSYRQKRKANILVEQQKAEVEKQKHLVENKNKEIIDSITYARRIQRSLLPQDKYIERSLKRMQDKKS